MADPRRPAQFAVNATPPRRTTAALAIASMVAATVVALLVLANATWPARAAESSVAIVDFSFEPATITILAGDTVRWTVTRAKDPHTVTPVDPPDAFVGSPLLRQGDDFAVTFAVAGTYHYECLIHPENMQATVVVSAAAATASPSVPATPTSNVSPIGSSSPGPSPVATAPDGASQEGLPPGSLLIAALAGAGLLGAAFLISRSRGSGA